MNPWPFVIGAYSAGIVLTAALLIASYAWMLRAETAAGSLKRP